MLGNNRSLTIEITDSYALYKPSWLIHSDLPFLVRNFLDYFKSETKLIKAANHLPHLSSRSVAHKAASGQSLRQQKRIMNQ